MTKKGVNIIPINSDAGFKQPDKAEEVLDPYLSEITGKPIVSNTPETLEELRNQINEVTSMAQTALIRATLAETDPYKN